MGTGIQDIEQRCMECNKLCSGRRSLGNHVAKTHGGLGGLQGYVLKHLLSGVVPKCACGCGGDVLWHKTLYRFNDYVTGHNSGTRGFCRPGFKHTPEQIAYRNACIKQAYESKKLRNRISEAVSSAFKDPVKNKNLSDGQKRGWAGDLERKRKTSERNCRLLALGIIGPQAPFKTEWKLNPFTSKLEFMHSSWETAFLDRCIREGYPVTKAHGLRVPYVAADGSEHVYVPDFVALEERVVFEVKGLMRENDDLKLQALDRWAQVEGYEVVLVQGA